MLPDAAAAPDAAPAAVKLPARGGLRLRSRLALLGIVGVLPLLLFVLGYQYIEYRENVDATKESTQALVRALGQLVDAEIDIRIAALETLATSNSLQTGDLARFRARAKAVVDNRFPRANIVLLRADGQLLMGTRFPSGTPLPVRPNLDSTRQVFATGEPAVSDLFGGTTGPVVAIDVPVKDNNGRVIYVLSMNPSMGTLTEIIRNQDFAQSWLISLFDRTGVILARFPNGDAFAGRQVSETLRALLPSAHEGVYESTSLEHIRLFAAFRRSDRYGWGVAIGVPQSELIEPALSTAYRTLSVGGLLVAFSLAASLYASRGIARPIRSLRQLALEPDLATLPNPGSTGLPEADEVAAALFEAQAERNRSRDVESMFRDGIDSIPEGFAIYDADDRLVMCNQSYRRLFSGDGVELVEGTRYEHMTRAGVRAGGYPAAAGHEEEWVAETVRLHLSAAASFEQHLANGSWVLVTNKRMSNGWLAGLRIDITRLKEIEKALSQGEERLRRVLESVPNGIVLVAPDGRIRMLNSTVERTFGYSRNELIDEPIEILVPERQRAGHHDLRAEFIDAPRARAMGAGRDLFGRRKDGSEVPVEIGLNPIETEEGPMVLAAIVDISERLAAEAARRETEQYLQDLQSELIHVSRLSTMGQMASTLAHELNQPLTAVISYLRGLKRLAQGELDPARVTDVIDRTVAQAARAGEVIRRLRDFVAKGETDRQPESLDHVVEEAVALALVGARQSGVVPSVRLDPDLPKVLIDKVQIQQVVLNLVRNAIEAMENSERRELAIATHLADGGAFCEIVIADSGPGIAPEIAERLFRPFTTTKKTGMGVGLSICREIVESHGGHITVASNPPTGTVFRVTVPTMTSNGPDDNADI